MQMDTKKITVLAMISAVAFIMAAFIRVPVVLFLRYDPKDVVMAIAGFIYGPMAAFVVAVIVSTVQMFTVSQTGPIGLVMNIISSAAFCCTAAYIYKKKRTMVGAGAGLAVAVVVATIVMMLWNYIVTPIFMGIPRYRVVELLLPAFLPFNLISHSLNAALSLLLYKHVKTALRAARLLPPLEVGENKDKTAKVNIGAVVIAGFVVVTCVLWVLVLQGVL